MYLILLSLPDNRVGLRPSNSAPPSFLQNEHSLNKALVNPHLIRIPRLRSFPTRSFSRRNLQTLRRQTHRAFDAKVLGAGALDQFLADFLEGLHFSARKRDPDLVDFLHMSVEEKQVFCVEGVQGHRQNLFRAFGRTFWRWCGSGGGDG